MNDISSDTNHFSFELLNDYVDGILDRPSFEQISTHLDECQECAETVSNIWNYYDHHEGKDRARINKYLEATKTNVFSALNEAWVETEKPTKVRNLWYNTWQVRIAATLLLVAIPSLIFIYQTNSAGALVDGYISDTYPNPLLTRGDSDQLTNLWSEAVIQYEQGNYAEAIPALEQIIRQEETIAMAHFYSGLCYLYSEAAQPEQAIVHFQEVIKSENPYYQQGLWYLSLAQFKAGEKQSSQETLEKITDYKQEEVQELLNKLNN